MIKWKSIVKTLNYLAPFFRGESLDVIVGVKSGAGVGTRILNAKTMIKNTFEYLLMGNLVSIKLYMFYR